MKGVYGGAQIDSTRMTKQRQQFEFPDHSRETKKNFTTSEKSLDSNGVEGKIT